MTANERKSAQLSDPSKMKIENCPKYVNMSTRNKGNYNLDQ